MTTNIEDFLFYPSILGEKSNGKNQAHPVLIWVNVMVI